jgi:hypothetical protein
MTSFTLATFVWGLHTQESGVDINEIMIRHSIFPEGPYRLPHSATSIEMIGRPIVSFRQHCSILRKHQEANFAKEESGSHLLWARSRWMLIVSISSHKNLMIACPKRVEFGLLTFLAG